MAYTEVSLDEANELLDLAGLSEVQKIEPLKGGWANSNYVLSLKDDSKIVLKVWDDRPSEEVHLVLKTTAWIGEHGIPTPVPIKFQNGEYMVLKNGFSWILMPFVEGEWLTTDYDSLFALGKVQAELHEIPFPENIHEAFSMGFDLWEKIFEHADKKDFDSDFIEMLRREMAVLKPKIIVDLPQGILHGDLFPDNVLGSNGVISGVLDFEEVCLGPKVFDLVMSFVGFGWEGSVPVGERWSALLNGYESVRALTIDEKGALIDFHRYATLSIAAWRYWKFVMVMPPSKNSDRYLEMVGRLDKNLPF